MSQSITIYFAWTAFQRRQVSMAHVVGFECVFMPLNAKGRVSKALAYLRALVKSVVMLRQRRPTTVWVQVPQIPALWAALIYRTLAPYPVRVVADCHNAQLRAPWNQFPLAMTSLRRSDVVLVHNEAMLNQAKAIGWPMAKVLVLEDVPAMGKDQPPIGLALKHIKAPKPWVVFPGSFAADEPIEEVLAAARLAPEISFIITGRPDKAKQNGHNIVDLPKNVVLPGFLPIELFDEILREADVVIGLTREEGIQLSVCNEALGFGRPLVTSNTQILSKLFGAAAVLVDTKDPACIADGCREALLHAEAYAQKSRLLANERLAAWHSEQLSKLHRLLDTSVPVQSSTVGNQYL